MERFFPRELKKEKVREFLTLKQDFLSIHEYGLKFNQLFRYASNMVKDMRSRINLFVVGLGRASSREGRFSMMIGDMDISSLMIYVQQVEEEKLSDKRSSRERELRQGMSSGSRSMIPSSRPSNKNRRGPAPSPVSAPAPKNKSEHFGTGR